MTMAVEVEGTTLVEGSHIGIFGDLVITIRQPDGFVREVPYSNGSPATPVTVEAMIGDMHIDSPGTREALRYYCLNHIRELDTTIGQLQLRALAYIEGFEVSRV